MILKKDCFAYLENRGCYALTKRECDGCVFYKSKKELKDQVKRLEEMYGKADYKEL